MRHNLGTHAYSRHLNVVVFHHGLLGGLLSFGLVARLGVAATETAGRLLAGGHGPVGEGPRVDPALLRQALEHALLPVFGVLLALAVLNLLVAGFFPARADEGDRRAATGDAPETAAVG